MLPTTKKLRQITQQAIAQGEERRRKQLAQIKEKEEQERKKHELIAEQVLAQVPSKCELEASNGRTHAIVMSLKWDRDYAFPVGNALTYDKLRGPGALVWNALREAELDPVIESWHDGVGMNSGFNIVVKW